MNNERAVKLSDKLTENYLSLFTIETRMPVNEEESLRKFIEMYPEGTVFRMVLGEGWSSWAQKKYNSLPNQKGVFTIIKREGGEYILQVVEPYANEDGSIVWEEDSYLDLDTFSIFYPTGGIFSMYKHLYTQEVYNNELIDL